MLRIEAEVMGEPHPKITLSLKEQVLKPHERLSIQNGDYKTTFILQKAKRSYSVLNTLMAVNDSGKDQVKVEIAVLCECKLCFISAFFQWLQFLLTLWKYSVLTISFKNFLRKTKYGTTKGVWCEGWWLPTKIGKSSWWWRWTYRSLFDWAYGYWNRSLGTSWNQKDSWSWGKKFLLKNILVMA